MKQCNIKLNTLTKKLKSYKLQANISSSFQQAVVDTLVTKTIKAAEQYRVKTIMLSGGVAANELLRKTLEEKAKKLKLDFFKPAQFLCTDNAAMIAMTAYYKFQKQEFVGQEITPLARYNF